MPLQLGLSREAFYSDYFEKMPCHLTNVVSGDDFSWRALSQTIYGLNFESDTDVKVHLDGVLKLAQYIERYQDISDIKVRLSKERLESLLRDGATLVVNRLDLKNTAIAALCKALFLE